MYEQVVLRDSSWETCLLAVLYCIRIGRSKAEILIRGSPGNTSFRTYATFPLNISQEYLILGIGLFLILVKLKWGPLISNSNPAQPAQAIYNLNILH